MILREKARIAISVLTKWPRRKRGLKDWRSGVELFCGVRVLVEAREDLGR